MRSSLNCLSTLHVHVRNFSGSPSVQDSTQSDEKPLLRVGEGDDVVEDGEIPPEVAELFDTLRGEALRRLDEFGPIHLFSLCWAYSTARLLDDDLHKQVTDAALRLGKARDDEGFSKKKGRDRGRDGHATEQHSRDMELSQRPEGKPKAESSSGFEKDADPSCSAVQSSTTSPRDYSDQPFVIEEGKHWMVLYKPPFWLVTVDSKEAMKQAAATPFEDEDDGEGDDDSPERNRKRPRLQMWIRQNLAQQYPVCSDAIEAFGLLHRLDAQTSGLLVCAKSYVGAYWLRLQWCSYTVDKEYICLVRGKVDPNEREIHKRIRIDKRKAENSRKTISTHCTISPSGKPSYTELVTLAHLVRPGAEPDPAGVVEHPGGPSNCDEYYSLVAVKLHTGRTHQIRVHMLSIGHPLVCDSKYAEDSFAADRKWCTRNFLHTYRVGFEDAPGDVSEDGSKANVNVFCPLPQDLRDTLAMLTPVDDSSRRHWEAWRKGDSAQLRKFEVYAEEADGADAAET